MASETELNRSRKINKERMLQAKEGAVKALEESDDVPVDNVEALISDIMTSKRRIKKRTAE